MGETNLTIGGVSVTIDLFTGEPIVFPPEPAPRILAWHLETPEVNGQLDIVIDTMERAPADDIEYSLDGGEWFSTLLHDVGAFSLMLTPNTTYSVRLRVIQGDTTGPATDAKSAKTYLAAAYFKPVTEFNAAGAVLSGGGNSGTFVIPAGMQKKGMFIQAMAYVNTSSATLITPPAGWTTTLNVGGSQGRLWVGWKFMGDEEPFQYNFGIANKVLAIAWKYVDPITPLLGFASLTNAAATSITYPALAKFDARAESVFARGGAVVGVGPQGSLAAPWVSPASTGSTIGGLRSHLLASSAVGVIQETATLPASMVSRAWTSELGGVMSVGQPLPYPDTRANVVTNPLATDFSHAAQFFALGDSITFQKDQISFHEWAMLVSGGRYYRMAGYNLGHSGWTSTQLVTQTSLVTGAVPKPTLCTVMAGTNDPTNAISATTTKANLRTIYNAFLAQGCRVIAFTILKNMNNQEAHRLDVNDWIRAQTDVIVIDSEAWFDPAVHTSDGTHPNALGARLLGAQAAPAFNSLVAEDRITDIEAGQLLAPITGNGGTLTGTTAGDVATGYRSFIHTAGEGGVVNYSKPNDDTQRMTFGAANGGQAAGLRQALVHTFTAGELYEAWCEVTVSGTGCQGFMMRIGDTALGGSGFALTNLTNQEVAPGTYTIRTLAPAVLAANAESMNIDVVAQAVSGDPNFAIDVRKPFMRNLIFVPRTVDTGEILPVAGQSNGLILGISGAAGLPAGWAVSARVKFWKAGAWVNYDPATETNWGPEVAYAVKWLAANPAPAVLYIVKQSVPGAQLGSIATYGQLGSSALDWSETPGMLSQTFTTTLAAAKATIPTIPVNNVLWIQGATDSLSPAALAAYPANFATLANKMRTVWGHAGTKIINMTVSALKVGPPAYDWAGFRDMLYGLHVTNPLNLALNVLDFVLGDYQADGIHLSKPSANIAGAAYFDLLTTGLAPSAPTISNLTIVAGSAAGSVVGTLAAKTLDGSGPTVFTLNTASNYYTIVGNQLRVKAGTPYPLANQTLSVRATSSSGLFTDASFDIAVTASWWDARAVLAVDYDNNRGMYNGESFSTLAAMRAAGKMTLQNTLAGGGVPQIDVLSVAGLLSSNAYTMLFNGVNAAADPGANRQYAWVIDDGEDSATNNDLCAIGRSGTGGTLSFSNFVAVGTTSRLNRLWDTPAKAASTPIRTAMRINTADFCMGVNGLADATQAGVSGGTIPVPIRLTLGDIIAGTRTWFGTKGSYQLLNATLSNAELAAITA